MKFEQFFEWGWSRNNVFDLLRGLSDSKMDKSQLKILYKKK
jgi:hypothetical protein